MRDLPVRSFEPSPDPTLEAPSPPRARLPADRFLSTALMALLAIATLGVVALVARGRMGLWDAIFLAAVPWVLLAAAFRPDWLLLGFVAAPASYTSGVPTTRLSLLIGAALVMMLVTRRRFSLGWGTGLAALLAINIAGYLFHAEVGSDALAANAERMARLTLFVLLALLAFNLAMLGELDGDRLATALVIGVLATLVFAYAGFGGAWFASGTDILTGFRWYVVPAALGVILARLFMAGDFWGRRLGGLLMAGLLLSLVIASGARALLLAVVITLGLLAFYLGKRTYVLILAVAVALTLFTTTARQHITRTETGDIAAELEAGDITTGRWDLWTGLWEHATPALPWGNGFGYMWSLSPESVMGQQGGWRTEEGRRLSPHSDFMYMFVEFGIPGFLLVVLFWFGLLRALRLISQSTDPLLRRSGWLFLGAVVAGLTYAFFGNLFLSRPDGERLFPVFGFIFGLAVVERARRRKPARLESPETTEEMVSASRP